MDSGFDRCRKQPDYELGSYRQVDLQQEFACSPEAGDALADYDRDIEQVSEAADSHYQTGRILFQKELYREAQTQFQLASDLVNDRQPEYIYWIGRSLEKLRDYDHADARYSRTLDLIDVLKRERFGEACSRHEELRCVTLYVRALLRMRWGRCDMARDDLDRTIELSEEARRRYELDQQAEADAGPDPTRAASETPPHEAADEVRPAAEREGQAAAPPITPAEDAATRAKRGGECRRLLANAHYCRALIYEKNGDWELAENDYLAAIDCSDRTHADAFYRLGCLREKQGMPKPGEEGKPGLDPLLDIAEAIGILEKESGRTACLRKFRLHRGRLYVLRKQFEEGIADFKAVIRAASRNEDLSTEDSVGIDACMARGLARLEMGKEENDGEKATKLLDLAIRDFTKVLRADAGCSLAFKYRADAYCLLRERNKAKENYDKAITVAPEFSRAFFKRALYRRASHPLEAIDDLSEAIRLDRNYTDAYYNRGLLRQSLAAELDDAAQDFRNVLQREPEHVYARYQLGRVYGMMAKTYRGRAQRAQEFKEREIKEYSTLIEKGHETYFLLMARAEALRAIGEKDRALRDMRKARRLKPPLLP